MERRSSNQIFAYASQNQIEGLLRASLSSSISDSNLHNTFLQLYSYYIFQSQRMVYLARSSEEQNDTIYGLMQQISELQQRIDKLQQENLANQVKLAQAVDQSVLLRHKQTILALEQLRYQQSKEIQDLKERLARASSAELEMPRLVDFMKEMKFRMQQAQQANKQLYKRNDYLYQENTEMKGKISMNYELLGSLLGENEGLIAQCIQDVAGRLGVNAEEPGYHDMIMERIAALLEAEQGQQVLSSDLLACRMQNKKLYEENRNLLQVSQQQSQELCAVRRYISQNQQKAAVKEPNNAQDADFDDFGGSGAGDVYTCVDYVFPLTYRQAAVSESANQRSESAVRAVYKEEKNGLAAVAAAHAGKAGTPQKPLSDRTASLYTNRSDAEGAVYKAGNTTNKQTYESGRKGHTPTIKPVRFTLDNRKYKPDEKKRHSESADLFTKELLNQIGYTALSGNMWQDRYIRAAADDENPPESDIGMGARRIHNLRDLVESQWADEAEPPAPAADKLLSESVNESVRYAASAPSEAYYSRVGTERKNDTESDKGVDDFVIALDQPFNDASPEVFDVFGEQTAQESPDFRPEPDDDIEF